MPFPAAKKNLSSATRTSGKGGTGDRVIQTSSGRDTTVLTLLSEMRERWDKADIPRKRARVIERFTYGRFNANVVALESIVNVPYATPPVSKNKLKNLALTWASRLTKNRTTSIAYPHDASDSDLAAAEVSNAILDNLRQQQNRNTLLSRAGIACAMHGTVGLYVPYDPDTGPFKERAPILNQWGLPIRDPITGEEQFQYVDGRGAPIVELLTIWDFVTSGEREANKGKWLLVRRWIDPDEAESILRATIQKAVDAGEPPPFDDSVSTKPVQNHQDTGATRDMVEGWEIWWRPNPMGRIPGGLYASVVSDKVTNAVPFPYDHGELPISVWRCMEIEEDFYGATWMEDALPQQLGLNHSLRVLAHRAEIAGQARIMALPTVLEKWGTSDDGMIECSTVEELEKGARVFEAATIPKDMYELCDRYEQGIDDTAGVSGVAASGDSAAATKNARLVAYATQIDEQKNEHAQRNLEEAENIVDAQSLKLCQQYWSKQRLVRVVGEDRAISASYFSGADINGVDVILEPAPSSERSRSVAGEDAEQAAAAGYLDPNSAGEMRKTGLPSTIDDGEARERLQALVEQALNGQPVQADLTIPSHIAIPELRTMLMSLTGQGPQATQPIRALLYEYEQQKGQDQSQGMQMPGQGPGQAPKGITAAPQDASMKGNMLPPSSTQQTG